MILQALYYICDLQWICTLDMYVIWACIIGPSSEWHQIFWGYSMWPLALWRVLVPDPTSQLTDLVSSPPSLVVTARGDELLIDQSAHGTSIPKTFYHGCSHFSTRNQWNSLNLLMTKPQNWAKDRKRWSNMRRSHCWADSPRWTSLDQLALGPLLNWALSPCYGFSV